MVIDWLFASLESPSPSDVLSGSRVSGSALSDGSSGVSIALSGGTSASSSFGAGVGGGPLLTPWDSDVEADPDPPDWTRNIDQEIIDKMTAKEKQRQEVVNGIFNLNPKVTITKK